MTGCGGHSSTPLEDRGAMLWALLPRLHQTIRQVLTGPWDPCAHGGAGEGSAAVLSSPRVPYLLALGFKAYCHCPQQNSLPRGLHCRRLFMQQLWVLLILTYVCFRGKFK